MNIKEFIQSDRFAKLLGIELIESAPGHAVTQMEIKDEHLNAVNIAQGGALFTLADLAMAAAANSYGPVAVSIQSEIKYFKAAGKGLLKAEASEISCSSKLATYSIDIHNTDGELIAAFQGMVYRKTKETI
jgi:acyl-CoA thioesterase